MRKYIKKDKLIQIKEFQQKYSKNIDKYGRYYGDAEKALYMVMTNDVPYLLKIIDELSKVGWKKNDKFYGNY